MKERLENKVKWDKDQVREYNKQKMDKAFDYFADMLIQKLESAKKTEWKQSWFPSGLSWPKSLYGKAYHGMNAFSLMCLCEDKGYKVPVFATRDRIFGMNYQNDADGKRVPAVDGNGDRLPFLHILKGETGVPVFLSNVSVVHVESGQKIKWSDYYNLSDDEKKDYHLYHHRIVYNVFNVDQTNMKEVRPELYDKLVQENVRQAIDIPEDEVFSFEPVDIMIDKQLWICPVHVRNLSAAESPHYSPLSNEVVLAMKSQYMAAGRPESWVNDCFHEMIHSTGHSSCLNRLVSTRDRHAYAREELVAEVSAALSCHRYGIPNTIQEDSIPYVDSWLKSLREKPEFIRTILKDVKLATGILDSKIEEVRSLYLKEDEEKKLDIRDDDVTSVTYDADGNVQIEESDSLGADRKQGDIEGKSRPENVEERRHSGLRV